MGSGVQMIDGTLVIDGERHFLVSADYPYYRDDPVHWPSRLRTLRDLGITVITCYIPWRHHAPSRDGEHDFDGRSLPSRNVISFLQLCKQLRLFAIVKPGPFVHGELDYGGLPDFVEPSTASGIEPMRDSTGRARIWQDRILPAPLDPVFSRHVERWMRTVGTQVIRPHTYPEGAIVAVQILNEGVYSDAQRPVWDYDYSSSALALYRRQLKRSYGAVEVYNAAHARAIPSWDAADPPRLGHPADAASQMDWGRFQSDYMRTLIERWTRALNTDLPVLLNLNPPLDRSPDHWLARCVVERWPNVNYGYTNWIGVVSHDASAWDRYVLLAKRGRGPNMEENWGFSELYDQRYRFPAVPFFQTVLTLAAGGTGFNVYTGVATEDWTDQLDTHNVAPYPDSAPVAADGTLTPKASTVRLLGAFCRRYGGELTLCRPLSPLALGFYPPSAAVAAWKDGGGEGPPAGHELIKIQQALGAQNVDFTVLNLCDAPLEDLASAEILVALSGHFMDMATQEKLAHYAAKGGRLIIYGEVPTVDERFRPATTLRDCERGLLEVIEPDSMVSLMDQITRHLPCMATSTTGAQVWVRVHPHDDTQYVFLLAPPGRSGTHDARYPLLSGAQLRLTVTLPGASAAVVRVERGRLSACLVKGIQELTDEAVTLQIRAGEDAIGTDVPCDLFAYIGDHGQPEAYAVGQGEVGVRFSGQLAREIQAIFW
jgi:beta-galactosidase